MERYRVSILQFDAEGNMSLSETKSTKEGREGIKKILLHYIPDLYDSVKRVPIWPVIGIKSGEGWVRVHENEAGVRIIVNVAKLPE